MPTTSGRSLMKNTMRRYGFAVAVLGLLATAAGHARAELVITFEDAAPENGNHVAQGYKGFQWTGGFGTGSWILATPSDGADGFSARSGTNYIWNNGGTSLTMSDGLFDFNSMWVRSGQLAGTGTAHGFLNGVEIFSQQFAVGTSYSHVALNFMGIDEIRIDQTRFTLVIDDISVNTPSVSATPEPSSLASTGTAALMLGGGWVWRRRKTGRAA